MEHVEGVWRRITRLLLAATAKMGDELLKAGEE